MLLRNFLLVAAGGAMGSMLRYAVSLLIPLNKFPLATFLINVSGAFIIGIVVGMHMKVPAAISDESRLFLATGLCGGFTTFSAFALENLQLIRAGNYGYFFLYAGGSLLFGIFATYLGLAAAK